MNQQQNAALESMKEWLAHPDELGKEPAKIELAGEFDLHELHYYIFKYKKSILGKWLLGVCGGYEPGETEHCGHVFSEMEPYEETTAKEKAIAMVEMIRSYWMEQAQKYEAGKMANDHDSAEDKEGNDSQAGSFLGFVLLSKPEWNLSQLKTDLKTDWDIDWNADENEAEDGEENADNTSFVICVDDMMAAVSLIEAPVPEEEAVANAANNYMWPGAVAAAKAHTAQILVAVLGNQAPVLERGKLLVKFIAACCKQETVLGVYTSGTVFQPRFYLDAAQMLTDGGLPVLNWIYFGLYQEGKTWNAYTYGMRMFGKEEMEVLQADAKPEELLNFLLDIVYYVLDGNVTLHAGETLGFSENQKLPITCSKSEVLEGSTLKIGFTANK